MSENSLFKVNGSQASGIVKEFLKYDISEGLTEFLEGETRIKSIMINDRKQILDNIAVIEKEISKIYTLMSTNPLYENSKEMQRAKYMLEQELDSLRKKWSAVNEEIEKQLKAAKDAAIQQGSATEKRGKPFWTIRAPKTPALPF
jgi:regulator of replication initiation timing